MKQFTCQPDIYWQTHKTAPRPTGWVGIVGLFDGYDGSQWLRYCNAVKHIWSGKIKQMKVWIVWKYEGIYMSTKNKPASRRTRWDGSVCHLGGYDVS